MEFLTANPTVSNAIDGTFKLIVEKMRLIAVALDCQAKVLFCNEHFLELTGWARQEVMGRDYFDLFIPKEHISMRGVFAQLLQNSPHAWHHDNEILCRSGRRLLIRWNNSPIYDASGSIIGVATIGEDITERRDLEARLVDRENRERRHIAAELHDGLGQTLFGAGLLVEGLEAFSRNMQSPIAPDLAYLSGILKASLATCRQIAQGLSPLADVKGGLREALNTLVKTPAQSHTAVVLVMSGDPAALIDIKVADQLYRIAQEALANALKHAQATRVEITLDIRPTSAELSVSDDGVGLSGINSTGGLGIPSMRHRAELIGASFSIQPSRERGTVVHCLWSQAKGLLN